MELAQAQTHEENININAICSWRSAIFYLL
jgi:hypothetical protein